MVESTGGGSSPAREREAGSWGEPRREPRRSDQDWGEGVQSTAPESEDAGVLGKVKQKASEWTGAASEKAKGVLEDSKALAQRSKETVKEWAHTAGEKADEARSAVGQGMERLGGGIREKGSTASAYLGQRLEAAGTYLREHDFASMNESVKEVVRRHPVQSVLVGIGLGFILARATRRS
jgi:ElaB/YqjD/DUF883 family membrane-anchored ribosome-binding protein